MARLISSQRSKALPFSHSSFLSSFLASLPPRLTPYRSPPRPPSKQASMENQPAPTRVSKRLKLARAAREKLQPRSNETLATLPKSTFIHSIVSALPSRDERFFPVGEGPTCRGTVAKEARKGGPRRRKG